MEVPLLKTAADFIGLAHFDWQPVGWEVARVLSMLDLDHTISVVFVCTFSTAPRGLMGFRN